MRILILGDLIGIVGRSMVQKHLAKLKQLYDIDATVVNGENSNNNGKGITPRIVQSLKHIGINVITTGNHIWDQRDILPYLKENTDVLRPANFPAECPGTGVTTFHCQGFEVAVINVQGRVFMKEDLDCPFKTVDSLLTYLKHKTNIILVDVHAEATAEKMALAYYLDGRVSCVVGTHTHVPTADERVLPEGTAYVSDLGMVGALNSLIGFKKEAVIERFKSQMPNKFMVEHKAPIVLTGIWVEIDTKTGKALQINRIKVVDEELFLEDE
ncbi:TIGR00282 family metallophosphoesterase [Candidatus Dependentiae bacterium]|nr:TIGR00282 family metallophosphoesterase [Candidatus Dependentiae bacterium]